MNIRDFPELEELVIYCGKNQRERVAFCVKGLCWESAERGSVSFKDCDAAKAFLKVKDLMYPAYSLVELQNAAEILERIYEFISRSKLSQGVDPAIILALMTDKDVLSLNNKHAIQAEDFYRCSVSEMIPYLKGITVNFTDPDLDW